MIVYAVVNIINDKVYIGQTIFSLEVRKYKHETVGNTGYYFHNAIRKYGKDNFKWQILCNCKSKEELNKKEKYYIKKYKSNIKGYGYNMTDGGESPLCRRHTKETRNKMSIAKMGKKHPHTMEWNKKIGLAQLGNKNHMYGKYGSLHHSSKKYVVVDINGNKFIVEGLSEFCRNNDLCVNNLNACASGRRNHHKGYKCRKYNKDIDSNLSYWSES